MRKGFVLMLAVAMFACGGSNPLISNVSADVPAIVPIVDGRTGQPIVDAPVIPNHPGEAVSIAVNGFFSLRTVLQGGAVSLWPADLEQTTRAFVYWNQNPGRMFRYAPGITTIGIQLVGILDTGQYREEIVRAAELLSNAHGTLRYVVGPGQFTVTMTVDPESHFFVEQPGAAAVAPMRYDTRTMIIQEGSVVVRSTDIEVFWRGWDNFRIAMAHELAHTTGLAHLDPTAVGGGIMLPNAHSYDYRDFTPTERTIMHLQYQRRPGTQLAGMQEDETLVAAQSTGKSASVVIVD